MEEPTYEFDWRYPITVPNPNNKSGVSVENGSFKWFQYWLDNECTYKEVADYFKTSESGISTISLLFKWKERRKNKEHYDSWKREQLTEQRYVEVLERAFTHKLKEWDMQELLVTVALIKLGIIKNEQNIPIPDKEISFKDLSRVIQNEPKVTSAILDDLYRALGKAPRINDTQSHNITADATVKTDVKVNLLERVKEKRRELNDLNSNGTTSNTSGTNNSIKD